MTVADFATKLDTVLRTFNLSRGALAHTIGIDKSVVSRWVSGANEPTDHNLSLLTTAVARHKPDFARLDWDLDTVAFARRLRLSADGGDALSLETSFAPAIVVLPLINLSGDAEQEYFADGITEDITLALSKWRSFRTIARISAFAYKSRAVDVRQVGRDLDARYVLEGSVRKSGDRLRISVELVDTATAVHVWAERYDRKLTDLFEVQDEISRAISTVIEPEMTRHEQHRAVSVAPASLEAWDCLNRGLYLLYKRDRTDNAAARAFFERAVALDPNLSRAHTCLAHSHQLDLLDGYSVDRAATIEVQMAHARRGVQLDDTDSFAHVVLAFAYLWALRHDMAVAAAHKAPACNPNDAWSVAMLGLVLDFDGRHREGAAHLERAMKLNPRDPRARFYPALIARAHLVGHDHATAEAWARQGVSADPEYPRCHLLLACVLGHLGREREAATALAAAERLKPGIAHDWLQRREYRLDADNDFLAEGLRKAGLKSK